MQQTFIEKIKLSLNEKSILKNISGWIFTNFHNRDLLTNNLLNINSKEVSTRRWVYIVNKNGNPIKILHKIEKESLSHLSGETFYYSSQKELVSILKSVCKKNTFAILKDKNIAVISTVDSGFVELLDKAKIKTASASSLVQLTKGTLSDSQIESQKKVAEILYKTIFNAWDFIKQHFENKKILTEMDVEQFILGEFAKNDIETDHPPIVAFGKNSGNPHYEVTNENNAICKVGDVIQLDIWGKLKNIENSVYADISWVGIYDTKVPNNVQECFNCLISARDSVLTTLN
ncbi:MAG: M24 family metallopeptidase, partial [Treponemataceae bacterium]|nr:M24 family metallopeptidase [Treponemataceae bacterium]